MARRQPQPTPTPPPEPVYAIPQWIREYWPLRKNPNTGERKPPSQVCGQAKDDCDDIDCMRCPHNPYNRKAP